MAAAKRVCGLMVCLMSLFSGCISRTAGASVAALYSGKIRPLHLNLCQTDYSRGMDASAIQPIEPIASFKPDDVQNVIPTNLDPNDQAHVGRKIIDNSLQHAINSDTIRHTSIGQTAQTVQQSMQTNVSIGSREPNSVKHEFKLAADPLQAQAQLKYSGLTNAQLSYHASESKTDFELREPVAAFSTDLVYNHIDLPGDRKDLMSLRWAW